MNPTLTLGLVIYGIVHILVGVFMAWHTAKVMIDRKAQFIITNGYSGINYPSLFIVLWGLFVLIVWPIPVSLFLLRGVMK